MKILAIESSSRVATCAVMDDENLLGEYIINDKMTHSKKLMPAIRELMNSLDLKPEDIDVYAGAVGPGSFTGLRIGLASIKAMAHAHEKEVIGIPTIDALAFNIPYAEGIVVPMMDARRDRVYTGIYKWEDGAFYTIMEQDVLPVEEMIDILLKRNERIIINGDGAKKYREILVERLKERVMFSPNSTNMPRASSVAELALRKIKDGKGIDYRKLVPDYLRKSQAEREYDMRMNGKYEE
ncbi:tRNA (adenosine(37)-N6)-threonylcarbamoyltransferase complex dimerization subunit type 1 TsaB [Clostridium sp. D2Q-11]|uniref:tRNA (Adenosine(37)-N6)-threonylcarbamoyltransferase complex dimerization subunit type 1 TsaB n=1 Tax=Anaeromonas frigoriresistens TaxID=2683708 RepID=A0A942V134_9FIRM|nr:tRNA (adenosine(37)-N6)-threonylcarbamoyltransferase complex dimerization subunit type 1 TsaB [Anaeromonas frigoriresistens]MBS4538097.1 tRNA (adenosine(37)-N6)-threonylcarbamoyltransferase complex dimerization subunit type 1 TsaB [Anaeromonas frigoriresistens]